MNTQNHAAPSVKCAIYTRTATREVSEASAAIQAQRKAAESFIADRAANGWVLLPERYDDPGMSGLSYDRPALERLISDARDGKIDCVVIHSFDRLFRSMAGMSAVVLNLTLTGVHLVTVVEPAMRGKLPLPRLVCDDV